MEKGYTYIARFVDHKGDFSTNYHKFGKSLDFKVREISLNSTHMPLDVQFIRVFETQHMSSLEKILHACFEELRVKKEREGRRKIITEWFDISDEELLHNKVDSIIKNFPLTTEVDLITKVQSDTGITSNQKTNVIKNLKERRNKWKLILKINGEDVSENVASETMANAFSYICNKIGFEIVNQDEAYLTTDKQELIDQCENWKGFNDGVVKEIDGYYLFTGLSNQRKSDIINKMIHRYKLTEMSCEVVQVS